MGKFDNALDIINKIQDGKTDQADAKNNQQKFKSYLGEIKKGRSKHKSKEQRNTLCNIEMLYKARNEAIKFYDDYSLMMSEVKAGNNSESLLNEIRHIVYSQYQSKQITKKIYNNIIKSIQ